MPAQNTLTVTAKDLPLSCPIAHAPLWNQHPRVFLTTDKNGTAHCPYCGTQYRVEGETKEH